MEQILKELVSQWNRNVFVSSFDAVIEYSDRVNLEEKGLILAQVQGYSPSWQRSDGSGGWKQQVTSTSGDRQDASRLTLSSLSPFCTVQGPLPKAQGNLPTATMSISTSINIIKIPTLPRYAQRPISEMILDSVKLTIPLKAANGSIGG